MKKYTYQYESEAELIADHVYYASKPEQYSIVAVVMSGNRYELTVEQYARTSGSNDYGNTEG